MSGNFDYSFQPMPFTPFALELARERVEASEGQVKLVKVKMPEIAPGKPNPMDNVYRLYYNGAAMATANAMMMDIAKLMSPMTGEELQNKQEELEKLHALVCTEPSKQIQEDTPKPNDEPPMAIG